MRATTHTYITDLFRKFGGRSRVPAVWLGSPYVTTTTSLSIPPGHRSQRTASLV
jgi:hypothetical protein